MGLKLEESYTTRIEFKIEITEATTKTHSNDRNQNTFYPKIINLTIIRI